MMIEADLLRISFYNVHVPALTNASFTCISFQEYGSLPILPLSIMLEGVFIIQNDATLLELHFFAPQKVCLHLDIASISRRVFKAMNLY